MAQVDFNIEEIRRQAGRLDTQAENLDSTSDQIIQELQAIYNIIRNSSQEDLQRWISVEEYAETFIAIHKKASTHFHNLAGEMRNWALETEREEQRAAGVIGRLNEPVAKISAMLNTLNS